MMGRERMQIDCLGKIYINEVFEFYDEPVLFSCKNSFGNFFVTVLLDVGETFKEWLFLPVSEARLIKAKKQLIDLYTLFSEPEDNVLWKVLERDNERVSYSSLLSSEQLTDDDLPDKGTFIEVDIDDSMLPKLEKLDEIIDITKLERREVLDISLEPNYEHAREIECFALTDTLIEVQSTIFAIADKDGKKQTPKYVKEQNTLNVSGCFAASFGIRLKANNLTDITGNSNMQANINILLELLDSKGDKQKFENVIGKIHPKAAIKYKELLETLRKHGMSFKAKCAYPNEYTNVVHINKADIEKSLKLYNDEIENIVSIIECHGRLTMVDYGTGKFKLKVDEENTIRGDIDKQIKVDLYRIPTNIVAILERRIEINQYTKKEEIRYKLMELRYI